MITVTGCKTAFGYKIHKPVFPYDSTNYIGYSLDEVKRKFRTDNGLQGKRINWIILGVER